MTKKARIGVIGAGWWAVANHVPILVADPSVDLGGVCRLGRAELDEIRDRFGFAFASEDYRDVLTDPDLDGVIIASPHSQHAEQTVAALNAGVHVLVEKPACVRISEALAMRNAETESGRRIMVPHGWNFRDYAPVARRWIAEGRIGAIRHVSLQMASPAEDLFTGKGFSGASSDMFQPQSSTWADPRASGGYGWGQLPHLLGILFYTAPLLEPLEVFGMAANGETGTDLFDAATIRFDGGILGAMSGAATVPSYAPFQVDIRIFGETGMVLIDLERERIELWTNAGDRLAHPMYGGEGAYSCTAPVEAFITLCHGKQVENRADSDMMLKCTRILDGFYRSVELGAAMRVSGDTPEVSETAMAR
jgi:predicted dehydrogenase